MQLPVTFSKLARLTTILILTTTLPAVATKRSGKKPRPPHLRLVKGGRSDCEADLTRKFRTIGRVLASGITNLNHSAERHIFGTTGARLAVSHDGEFFAICFDGNHYEVRETKQGTLLHRRAVDTNSYKHLGLEAISKDGRYLAVARRLNRGGAKEAAIINMEDGQTVYSSKGESTLYYNDTGEGGTVVRTQSEPPQLSFFENGYMALFPTRVETFDFNKRRTKYFSVDTSFVKDPGSSRSPLSEGLYLAYNRSFIFFLHGDPPARLTPAGTFTFFEDVRKSAEDAADQLYSGYDHAISQSGHFVLQFRSSGSSTFGDFRGFYDIFTSAGKWKGAIPLPYFAGKAAMRSDDSRIAIAMYPGDGKQPEIWIFPSQNLNEPQQVLRPSGMVTIDYLAFTDSGALIAGSNATDTVLSFDLDDENSGSQK
jgi:hypothetical protein